ncbi:TrmB family transcriptional regulator sugar-binding domain-containing protein [Nocardia sp. NPDC004604]|uniref:TrmB family transcriptional regulator sugar-binding domain-containing protein n=1 Tax=Nocardia sp. NPDC004604 TaxID=3157013 RepID=UPI00339EDB29
MINRSDFIECSLSRQRDQSSLQNDLGQPLAESQKLLDIAVGAGASKVHVSPLLCGDRWGDALHQLIQNAREEVIVAVSNPSMIGRHHGLEQLLIEGLVSNGRQVRLLRSSGYARSRALVPDSSAMQPHIRIAVGEFDNTVIVDRKLSVVWSSADDLIRRGFVVDEPALIAAIRRYTLTLWNSSAKILPGPQSDGPVLDDASIAVMTALNTGMTDEAAARTLSVSVRTYRRYIAEVMTRLGVTTRFQLGVRASELGALLDLKKAS